MFLGADMIHLVSLESNALVKQAVFTASRGSCLDFAPQAFRDVAHSVIALSFVSARTLTACIRRSIRVYSSRN